MADVDDVGIISILRVQVLEGSARTLARHPVLRILHLVEKWLEHEVLGLLVVCTVPLVNEAAFKKLHEGVEAGIADRLVRLVEENIDDANDDSLNGGGHRRLAILAHVDQVELVLGCHVSN